MLIPRSQASAFQPAVHTLYLNTRENLRYSSPVFHIILCVVPIDQSLQTLERAEQPEIDMLGISLSVDGKFLSVKSPARQ